MVGRLDGAAAEAGACRRRFKISICCPSPPCGRDPEGGEPLREFAYLWLASARLGVLSSSARTNVASARGRRASSLERPNAGYQQNGKTRPFPASIVPPCPPLGVTAG